MNKKLFKLEAIGFIFVSIVGTLSHFLYDWLGKNVVAGIFCPVNESPWEHLKLLFFPFTIYAIYMYIKLKDSKFNVFFASYISIVCGMTATLCYFYTLNGMIGGNNEWVNISSFFVGVLIAFVLSYFLINNSIGNGLPNGIGAAMMIVTMIAFWLFTFEPPIIELFKDPTDLTYGIKK